MKYKIRFEHEKWASIYGVGLEVWVPKWPKRSTVFSVKAYLWKHSTGITVLDRKIYEMEQAMLEDLYDDN